jgi:hypothetical protein
MISLRTEMKKLGAPRSIGAGNHETGAGNHREVTDCVLCVAEMICSS